MNNIKDGGTAFPVVAGDDVLSGGMSLRDYFAAAALTGLAALDHYQSDMIKIAWQLADGMLAAREKGGKDAVD